MNFAVKRKYNLIISSTLLVFSILVFSACNGSNCEQNEYSCRDNYILLQCNNGTWEESENCGDNLQVCSKDKCIERPEGKFSVEKRIIEKSQTITLDFSDPFSEYILLPYNFSSRNETIDYSFAFSENLQLSSEDENGEQKISSRSSFPSKRAFMMERDYQMRVRDRNLWQNSKKNLLFEPKFKTGSECETSYECGALEICENGECTDSVNLKFSAWTIDTTLTARVAAKGDKCVLLTDTADQDTEWELSEKQIGDFLNACDKVIFPRTRAFFGDPAKVVDSPLEDASDKNGDGLLQILFSGKVNEEGVWGFFSSADFYRDTPDNPSNERDMLYVSLPENSSEIASIKATMIHEYQHLIHFTIHNYIPYLNNEDRSYNPIWLDESFAHLSEEIGGYGMDNIWFVESILKYFSSYSLIYGSDNLQKRALGFLFVMYLFEQSGGFEFDSSDSIVDLGGPEFLKSVIASENSGLDALEESLNIPLEDIYLNWLVAVLVNDKGITEDQKYKYNDIITDPLTGYETGVMTYGNRTDIYGTDYQLEGPKIFDITVNPTENTLQSAASRYYRITSEDGNIDVDVSTLNDSISLGIIRIH